MGNGQLDSLTQFLKDTRPYQWRAEHELDIPEMPFEYRIGKVEHFSLEKILASGQAFRWRRLDDGSEPGYCKIYIPVQGHNTVAEQTGNVLTLFHDGPDEAFWQTYLALNRGYEDIISQLHNMGSAQVDTAIAKSDGVRVLNQPFFECAVTFLCSQNSNIRNITRSIEKLCGGVTKAFPAPEEVIEKLESDSCSLGYRVDYIKQFAQDYMTGKFDEMERLSPIGQVLEFAGDDNGQRMSFKTASETLCRQKGIGPKVAACICLFSLGYEEAVPRDVWIKRAEEQGYVWHDKLGGIEQQFVFFAMTNQEK